MRALITAPTASLLAVLLLAGCIDREPIQTCAVREELVETWALIGGFEGVDLLIVLDNSGSMAQEQATISAALVNLVNSLIDPYGWYGQPVDDLRIAVVSSNMGLGTKGRWESCWPDPEPPPDPCEPPGDDGLFQSYNTSKWIDLAGGEIKCTADGDQCPEEWTCAGFDDGVGSCAPPWGEEESFFCGWPGNAWAQSGEFEPERDLALQTACSGTLGHWGCDWQQQLLAGTRALERPDQSGFVRDLALLSVVVISDADECSVADWPGMQSTPELADLSQSKLALACGSHPEHLSPVAQFAEQLAEIKGHQYGFTFSAIVGVPDDEVCQGRGSQLDECLDRAEMQLAPLQNDSGAWYYAPSCERTVDDLTLASATPGRRFVELAQEIGWNSRVQSICSEDWSPALWNVFELMSPPCGGAGCAPCPLPWDAAEQVSECTLRIEYVDVPSCPKGLVEIGEKPFEYEDGHGIKHHVRYCELPRLPASIDCAEAIGNGACDECVGWYYCENTTHETFNGACEDLIDNDDDGFVDCEDVDCQPCPVCGGNGVGCDSICMYDIRLTHQAKVLANHRVASVVCPVTRTGDDPNCREDTRAVCNDGVDNDDNGIWDCTAVIAGEERHDADFACCPMHVDEDHNCVIEPAAFEICQMSAGEPSDACREHARLLQCRPP